VTVEAQRQGPVRAEEQDRVSRPSCSATCPAAKGSRRSPSSRSRATARSSRKPAVPPLPGSRIEPQREALSRSSISARVRDSGRAPPGVPDAHLDATHPRACPPPESTATRDQRVPARGLSPPADARMSIGMRSDTFERLFEQHAERLFSFLAYRTGNRALAEDLLSETFERVLRSHHRFDPRRGKRAADGSTRSP
jgi:hypothetical protein